MSQLNFGGADVNRARRARGNEDLAHRHLGRQSKLAGGFGAVNLDSRLCGIGNCVSYTLDARRHDAHEPIHPRTCVNTLGHCDDYTFVCESRECVVDSSP